MIVYATMGSGKSMLISKYPERFVDADQLLNNAAREHGIVIDDIQQTGKILFYKFRRGHFFLPPYWDIIKKTIQEVKKNADSLDVLGSNVFIYDIADVMYIYTKESRIKRFNAICDERHKAREYKGIIERELYWQGYKPFRYIEENKYLSDYLLP